MLYLLINLNLPSLHLAPISLSFGSLAPCFPITKTQRTLFYFIEPSF